MSVVTQYVLLSIFLALLVGYYLHQADPEKMKRARMGANIAALGFMINIIYTAFMGWNQTAQSTLEWALDIFTSIILFGGILIIMSCSRKKSVKRSS
ncbi:hypothetical protein GZH47_33270 (plasmid) [Paenibacillus rhizovicinus]|uniref:Uncharacterized protein n=1 Tax=Paenibacillus rhizovicinus TaxID=2704463 RepID=A0A6C0PBD9_9BACL|nr:hypothetical protein [Paenibacillus rhizovicinus]QHW35766.1 hypothetical protein GZH47_33270 [Paenibacillus rhizovicinus]